MAKSRVRPAKRETPAHRRNQEADRYIRLGLVAVAVLVVVVLSVGLYRVAVAAPNEPVAVVAGTKITTREYQAQVRLNRLNLRNRLAAVQEQLGQLDASDESSSFVSQLLQQQLQSLQSAAASLPLQTLDDLISQALIRQEAQRRGIAATQEEVDKESETWFGYDPNPPTPTPTADLTATAAVTPEATATAAISIDLTGEATSGAVTTGTPGTEVLLGGGTAAAEAAAATAAAVGTPLPTNTPGPTPTPVPTATPMTREGYESLRGEYLSFIKKQAGFSEAQFRSMMEATVLRRKLQEALAAEVPSSAPQLHLLQIVVGTQEDADKAVARLKAGESFATVATEVSTDPSKEQGGDMGWVSEWNSSVLAPVYQQALEANLNEPVIVSSWEGFHVIEVTEKSEDRPLDEIALEARRSSAIDAWLQVQMNSEAVQRHWSSTKVPADDLTG